MQEKAALDRSLRRAPVVLLVGPSWEGFVIEEVIRRSGDSQPYFWRTKDGAELDLLLDGGQRVGFEI